MFATNRLPDGMGHSVDDEGSSQENGTLERGRTAIGSRLKRSSDSDVAGACRSEHCQ